MSLWDALVALYDTPRFWAFPIGSVLIGMAAFLLFALPLTWAAARNVPWLRRYRIQARSPKPDIFWPALRQFALNNAVLLLVVTLLWPIVQFSGVHLGPLPPWWEVVWQLVFFIYLDDAVYYAFHRFMHRPWWFRRVHGLHHRVFAPWAITGHHMHPFEYVATGLIATLGPTLVGAHTLTLWIWVIFRQWEAAEGHCGYDLPFSPTRWLPGSHGAVHHDYHHARVRGNFGGFLPIWDRLLQTLVPHYERDRHQRPFASPPKP